MPEALKLYHAPTSPNSRRVRMFLAEKGISLPLVSIDLAAGEQHGDAYRAINPRRVVPSSAGSFHGKTMISALGASEATSVDVCSGCAGTSSGSTRIGVRQPLIHSRDTL